METNENLCERISGIIDAFKKEVVSCLARDPLSQLTKRSTLLNQAAGNAYYISGSGDDGNGDGTSSFPWQTIEKVQSVLKDGDVVFLGDGNYGDFEDTTNRVDWVTYMANTGCEPVFNNIKIRKGEVGRIMTRFWGVSIAPVYLDPSENGCNDPQYLESTSSSYSKVASVIDLLNVSMIEFYQCAVFGYNKHLVTRAFNLNGVENLRVEGCDIHTVSSGFTYSNSINCRFYYNEIHNITSGHFHDGKNNCGIIIEGNHGYDCNWELSDDYCPRQQRYWYHGSYVSIKSSNTIVRGNHFHDGGLSSGVMLYASSDNTTRYDNVLIEDNLIYDTHNGYCLRVYCAGDGVVIRNNIIVGKLRNTTNFLKRYNTAVAIHSIARESSVIQLHNNIIIGSLNVGAWISQISESGNLLWSVLNEDNQYITNMGADTKVFGEEEFVIDFFKGDFTADWPLRGTHVVADNPNPCGHGQIIDFDLSDTFVNIGGYKNA